LSIMFVVVILGSAWSSAIITSMHVAGRNSTFQYVLYICFRTDVIPRSSVLNALVYGKVKLKL
jgi:hypothetical protein